MLYKIKPGQSITLRRVERMKIDSCVSFTIFSKSPDFDETHVRGIPWSGSFRQRNVKNVANVVNID